MINNSGDRRKHELVSNEDLKRLVESREGSGFVSMLHPLELFMPREQLEDLTRRSLADIRSSRDFGAETDEQRVEANRSIQQRVDFLSWLAHAPDKVYMSLYPADIDGLDDLEDLDDLQEILEDEQKDLPF